jgi:hypothetical protein
MSWISITLENTLLDMDNVPTEGALEFVNQMVGQGHRVTVLTKRIIPMPDTERQRIKEETEQELESLGFPPVEVWSGTTLPMSDYQIGSGSITYDNDWGLVAAQLQMMVTESQMDEEGNMLNQQVGGPNGNPV